MAFAHDFLVEFHRSNVLCLAHVFSDEKLVVAVFEHPTRLISRRAFLVVARKFVFAYIERKFLLFSALKEIGFCIRNQFSCRLHERAVRLFDVHLHDGFSASVARIFDFCRNSRSSPCALDARRHVKSRIRESESERVQHLFLCKRLEVSVPHENVLFVNVEVLVPELIRRGINVVRHAYRIRKSARRIDLAREYVDKRAAAFHTALPSKHDRGNSVAVTAYLLEVDDVARI